MAHRVRLRVWGTRDCLTGLETKGERVCYDVTTPSATHGILEAILWKPQMRRVIDRIPMLKPIRFQSFRRSEVGAEASAVLASASSSRATASGGPRRCLST